jgi:hypothetical protein
MQTECKSTEGGRPGPHISTLTQHSVYLPHVPPCNTPTCFPCSMALPSHPTTQCCCPPFMFNDPTSPTPISHHAMPLPTLHVRQPHVHIQCPWHPPPMFNGAALGPPNSGPLPPRHSTCPPPISVPPLSLLPYLFYHMYFTNN